MLGEVDADAVRGLRVDLFERVGAGLADLGADVLRRRHVEVAVELVVPGRLLVERADPVAKPLAGDEERTPDVEAEGVVLERCVPAEDGISVAAYVQSPVRNLDAVDRSVVPVDAHLAISLFAGAAESGTAVPA